eukprot:6422280-Amphidinium_carterae.1
MSSVPVTSYFKTNSGQQMSARAFELVKNFDGLCFLRLCVVTGSGMHHIMVAALCPWQHHRTRFVTMSFDVCHVRCRAISQPQPHRRGWQSFCVPLLQCPIKISCAEGVPLVRFIA